MNIQEYIESGIIDAYVLGGLSPEENLEVETHANNFHEIAEEIKQARFVLEQIALKNAVTPPAFLKEKLFEKISTEQVSLNPETKTISMFNMGTWSIAASWAVGITFGGLAFYYRSQWKNSEQKLIALETQNKELADNFNVTKFSYEKATNQLSSLSDTSLKLIALKQLENKPFATAQVFWSKSKEDVYLSARYFPSAPEGKQYQLWAIVDGKPVDAGVVPSTGVPELFKMKNIGNATAFAITIEPLGGSVSPTLEAMCVMGGV
jgi:anti-sigma-K factor RskA